MDRRLFLGVVLTTVLAGMFALAFSIQAVKASGTIYIRADESGNGTVTAFFRQLTVAYTLRLGSREECGCTSNVGTIVLDGVAYSLPQNISKEAWTYSIRYDADSGYEFIQWETSGEASITDNYNSSTTVTVNGNSTIVALYRDVTRHTDVTVSEAKQMIGSNPNLMILDVRNLGEYESGHIQNATLIPLAELAGRLGELNKDKEILVYCGIGGRSARASQTLTSNGFSKVYNMLGGITAWINAGYWIETTHNGNLMINGTQTYVIENCTYIQKGNVSVEEESKLVIRNAKFIIGWDYYIRLFDYSNLSTVNAIMHIQGNFSSWSLEAINMINSTLTRSYNVSTTTGSGFTVAGASLNLYDKNNVSICGGIANSSGEANFDVSFADGNYTDNLRLEASKSDWSGTLDMMLLSDTPLILRLQCNSDLNADGKVDIIDIAMVAKAYGAKKDVSDGLYWHEIACENCPHSGEADLDKSGEVNIIDISMVAKDYGKAV